MRSLARLGLLLPVAILATSCDTDQPLLVAEQIVEILFDAPGANVRRYNVWDMFEDTMPQDGQPDDINGDAVINGTDIPLWCEFQGNSSAASVPWPYSVEISLLKAGELVATRLTSNAALVSGTNRACFDNIVGPGGAVKNDFNVTHDSGRCTGNMSVFCNPASTSGFCSKNGLGTCTDVMNCANDFSTLCTSGPDCPGSTCIDDITRRFIFDDSDRRRISQANQSLLQAKDNLIYNACIVGTSGDACTGEPNAPNPFLGRCPGYAQAGVPDLGDPRLDGDIGKCEIDHPSFSVTLDKGDTLIVEAARFNTQPPPIVFNGAGPSIQASVFIDGIQLQADEVTGTTATGTNSTSAISFFFTSK